MLWPARVTPWLENRLEPDTDRSARAPGNQRFDAPTQTALVLRLPFRTDGPMRTDIHRMYHFARKPRDAYPVTAIISQGEKQEAI